MAQAGRALFGERRAGGRVSPPRRTLRLKPNGDRREGSLAAALVQSMALAVISTAGAYPSWVLVTNPKWQVVLGASWALSQADPPRDSPLLGPSAGGLMVAIAFCCLFSVVTGASAIGWDFLGRRKCRRLGPMLHCLTALLITSASALGSSLLGAVRGQTRSVPELQALKFTASPGQSLFLSFLACALASTATGLSCSSPALVAPSRSSRDMGRPFRRRLSSLTDDEASPSPSPMYVSWQDDIFFDPLDLESSSSPEDDERPSSGPWYSFFKLERPQAPRQDRWRRKRPSRQQQQQPQQEQPAGGEDERYSGQPREPASLEEEGAVEKHWEPRPLPQEPLQRELAQPPVLEDAIHARQLREKETDQEDPARGDAEVQLSLVPELLRVKSGEKTPQASESQAAETGLVESLMESQDREKQDSPTIAI